MKADEGRTVVCCGTKGDRGPKRKIKYGTAFHERSLIFRICSQFYNMRDYTVSKETSVNSISQRVFSTFPLHLTTAAGMKEMPFNFSPRKHTQSSRSPSFSRPRSCFKVRQDHVKTRECLASCLECHVHFDTELDSRWSNGSTRASQPLQPLHRSDSICHGSL